MRATLATLAVLALVGCNNESGSGPVGKGSGASTTGSFELQGAGATFPFPLYSKWIAEYQRLDPQVRINYQSIGSGGGIRQILERTVDFGASDAPMTEAEAAKAKSKLLHIPMTIGAVVITYNLPGVASGLKLTPAALAGIFLGEIKMWNAPGIAEANPGVKLPETAITVVHRSDGSGTTSVFTEYLAKISPAWKEKVGAGKSVKFPLGVGAKGNEGVSGQVKTTPGAIGYTELAYATQTGLPVASVQNREKTFAAPTLPNIAAAAASATMPDDLKVSIIDPPGKDAYPIAAFTYILVYEQASDAGKAKALARFLWWAVHEGQALGAPLSYAPLPREVLPKVEAALKTLRSSEGPLLPR